MIELKRDDRRIKPGVDRVQHGASHRYAVMSFEHRRRIGKHDGHGVAGTDAAFVNALASRRHRV